MSRNHSRPLLVHAGIGSCGFNRPELGMDESWVHHGLASIGSYLKTRKIPFNYLDLRRLKSWAQFTNILSDLKPSFAGISATTVDADAARRAAELIKAHDPRTVTVVGGVHASVCPEFFEDCEDIDHLVIGEGERSFADLISGKNAGRIVTGQGVENLDFLPFVDRGVFGHHETPIFPPLFPGPFMTFIASRGCPFNCSFCQPAERLLFGKCVRSRSPENLVAEIDACAKGLGMKSYLIHDDCLLWNPDWVQGFLAALQQYNINIPFAVQARADLICKEPRILCCLAEHGLRMVLIGFESGSQRILDFLRKGTTVEQNLTSAEICRKSGIAVWANYMFGIPGESPRDIDATVKMIRTIRPAVHSPSFFVPYPGTDLGTYCERHGLSLLKRPNDFRRNPEGAKLKNIDYRALRRAVRLAQGGNPVIFQLRRWKNRIQNRLKL